MKFNIKTIIMLLTAFFMANNVFAGRAASKYQAVESCKYTTPKCTTTSNGATTSQNTTCNGTYPNKYSDTALRYEATSNGNNLYVEWTQDGTGQAKRELISFNDIQVNSCSTTGSDLLKTTGIQACQGVSPLTTGVNSYKRCDSSQYYVTRSTNDLNKLILTYNPYGNSPSAGNDYKEWKYLTPSQLNIATYQNSNNSGSLAAAINSCKNTLQAYNICTNGNYNNGYTQACGHSAGGNYSITLLGDGSVALSGTGDKYLESTTIPLNTTNYDALNIPSCNPASIGNFTSAINSCKNKITQNDCGVHFTDRVCSGTLQNGYVMSSVDNGFGGADIKIKGVGNTVFPEFIANPNGVDAYGLNIPNCSAPPIQTAQEPTTTDALSACSGTTLSCNVGQTQCSNTDFVISRSAVNDNNLTIKYSVDSSHINSAFNGKTWTFTHTQLNMNECVAPATNHYALAKAACSNTSVACGSAATTSACGDSIYSIARGPFSSAAEDEFVFSFVDNGEPQLLPVQSGDYNDSANNPNACNTLIKESCKGAITACNTVSVSTSGNTSVNVSTSGGVSSSCSNHHYSLNRNLFDPSGNGSGGEMFITKQGDTSFNLATNHTEMQANACYSNDDHRTNALNKCSNLELACGSSDVNQSCGTENGFDYRISRTGFDKFLNTGGAITISAVDSSNNTVWAGVVSPSAVNAQSCSVYSQNELYNMAKTQCAGKSVACSLNSESETSCGSVYGANFSVIRKDFATAEDAFKFKVEYQGQTLLNTDVNSGDFTPSNANACESVIKSVCASNGSAVNSCSNSAISASCGYHGYALERSAYDAYGNNNDGSGGELSITKNGNFVMSVLHSDLAGINECKSNNYYLNNQTCSGKADSYCKSGGFSNRSCGSGYSLSRSGYDMDNDTGGDLTIKLPNNNAFAISYSDVGATACISAAQHRQNAETSCAGIWQLSNSCPNFGDISGACGSANMPNYRYDRTRFNNVTGTGGQITLSGYFSGVKVWERDTNASTIGAFECAVEVPEKETSKDATDINLSPEANIESPF